MGVVSVVVSRVCSKVGKRKGEILHNLSLWGVEMQ